MFFDCVFLRRGPPVVAMSNQVDEFLTVEELAALLRTTPSAIYVQRHRGQAPASLGVLVGRKLIWRRRDVDAWWDSQLQTRTPGL